MAGPRQDAAPDPLREDVAVSGADIGPRDTGAARLRAPSDRLERAAAAEVRRIATRDASFADLIAEAGA